MRVLVVSQYFWPEDFRINELVADLGKRGHSVTVLTGVPNYPEGRVMAAYSKDPGLFRCYAGADVVRVPLRARGRSKVGLLLNYLSFVVWGILLGPWRLRGRRFDVILVFGVSPVTAALPALLLRRLRQTPLLLWVLDLWPESLSAVGVVRSERWLRMVGRLVTFVYRRSDLILAQSRDFFPSIARWAESGERIRYFPAWTEATFEADASTEVAPELAPYATTFNVLFAGNIGEAQDFPAVLEAASRLRDRADIRWLVLGDGRAAGQVRALIAQRGLADRVVLLGRYPLERMPSFFRGASALLVSLKAEPVFSLTIPGKVQNYLASGLPVLGMLDGAGARVIEEAGAGLTCRAGDGAALADRVLALASMTPAERSAMGERGRAYAKLEFDRATLLARLEGWARELVGRSPGA